MRSCGHSSVTLCTDTVATGMWKKDYFTKCFKEAGKINNVRDLQEYSGEIRSFICDLLKNIFHDLIRKIVNESTAECNFSVCNRMTPIGGLL